MPPTNIVSELELDPTLYSSASRSNLEETPSSHYINTSFCDKLKKFVDFEVEFSFEHNYGVVAPSRTDTLHNPSLGYIVVYLETLEYEFWFLLSKVVMEILQMYDITITHFIPSM